VIVYLELQADDLLKVKLILLLFPSSLASLKPEMESRPLNESFSRQVADIVVALSMSQKVMQLQYVVRRPILRGL